MKTAIKRSTIMCCYSWLLKNTIMHVVGLVTTRNVTQWLKSCHPVWQKIDKSMFQMYPILVFPWDATSRGTFQDKPGRDVPLSLCPGTRAGANVSGQNELKNFKKMTRFPVFEHHFRCFRTSFPVLECPFLFQNILFCFRTSFPAFKHSFLL